jgi:cytidylate kinase
MAVITVSRGSFSGGKILAECLAQKLGYRCVDRDIIVERAAAFGASEKEIREALEKPPGFLERFSHSRYVYLTLIQAALTEEVRDGMAVYHGNAGHLLLQGGPHILRTRIIAPMEFRIRMAQERLKFSRDEAIAYINKVDQDRRRWTHFLYGVDWGDPALYDIVLNLENVDISEACDTIATLAKERCFDITPRCRQKLEDMALASRVRASLAVDASTSDLEVEVTAKDGVVAIHGKLSTVNRLGEVESVAKAVPGVATVQLDGMSLPAGSLTH